MSTKDTGSMPVAAMPVKDFDWSATPLGKQETWPQALRTIFDMIVLSPMPSAILWGESGYLIYNDEYAAIAGAKHPSILGRSAVEAWPEAASFNQKVIDTVLAGGTLSYTNLEFALNRSGLPETVWLDLNYSPIVVDGKACGVMAFVHENTSRVLADQLATEESAAQRRLFAQMPGFVAVLKGPAHVYEYVNDAYIALAGARDYRGRTVRSVFPELEGQGFFELLDEVYRDGRQFVANAIPVRLEGEPAPRYIDLLYEPIRNPLGYVTGIFVGGYDVTEAHRTTIALRELNETLEHRVEERTKELRDSQDFARLALSAVGGVGVWTYEVAVDKFFYDAAIADLYAIDPAKGAEGILRRDFLANVHPEDRTALSVTMAGGLVKAGDLELEYRLVHPDGSVRWVLSKGHTYFEADGTPYRRTGVGVDMTTKRVLEEQFRQAQKMEAVGQLTGGIAHDFNNLLAGIVGSLDLLERRLATGRLDNLDRYINGAQTSAKRAAALTQRLLAFSRRQTLAPKPVDAAELATGMEELISRTVGPSIAVEIVKGEDLWLTNVDPSQLENAILNLSINARDAQPGGGSIVIRAGNMIPDAKLASRLGLIAGEYVTVSVSDRGTGMSPSVIARAYDPFFTTKPLGQGTGLGLSMIHGFVVQSGGQVDIASVVGEGSTVTLYLPRYHGQAPSMVAERRAVERTGSGETILIIDDEILVRSTMAELLQEKGYEVLEADDGPAGLKLLDSPRRIDLLITDVGLPGGLNGRQVADAARQLRPDLTVLFVTGYAANSFVGKGVMEAGMHVLTKPFELDTLAEMVGRLIEDHG